MNEKMELISQRIKELREVLDMTAEETAKISGVSLQDYLSYEAATSDMPISALYAIASALKVDPTELLTGETPRMKAYTIVRQEKGVSIERYSGYSFSSLATNFVGREMEPMIVELRKKQTPPQIVTHKGQEFNYVLEGTVRVYVAGKCFDLNKSDSIYFDSTLPHGQAAVTDGAKFLTILNEYSCKD